MAYGRSSSGPQYSGYAALIFWELANWGKNNETNKGLLLSLEKCYSHIRAKLPESFDIDEERFEALEKNPDDASSKEKKFLKMQATLTRLGRQEDQLTEGDEGGEFVKARKMLHCLEFDGVKSCTEKEEDFLGLLFGIYENLDEITAVSKMIDNERMPANSPPPETT